MFSSRPLCNSWNWNSQSNSFVRAPSSGGGSNPPRSAVSVPHLDVNADDCRAKQAKSCKSIACQRGIPEILVVSSRLQRLDDLQNYHHFRTAITYYLHMLNFPAAFSRAIVLLDICSVISVCLFCVTSAGLDRMNNEM